MAEVLYPSRWHVRRSGTLPIGSPSNAPPQHGLERASPAHRPVVLVPTYNNAATLLDVLERICGLGLPVLVVNDGSTDATPDLLSQWAQTDDCCRTVVDHARNCGKAAALQSGFNIAASTYTHAVTIDSDGQLEPDDIPQLLKASRRNPAAIVLGYRDDTANDYPTRSRIGRRLSNWLVELECGRRVQDSQCGLRIYPIDRVMELPCRAGRFGYETEILTRAIWAGIDLVELPVRCLYFSGEQRVTHFRAIRDTLAAARLHSRLLVERSLSMRNIRQAVRWKCD